MPSESNPVQTILIRGNEIPVEMKLVDQTSLNFFVDNPRVYSILRAGGKDPSQEEIQSRLQELEHVKELAQDIRINNGLIEPLIVKTGTLEVLEGNSRLAAYRLLAKTDPVRWGLVKCTLLPANIDDALVFTLLGQFHIKGKKDWAPYEQAGFLYRRYNKHNEDPQAIAKEIGISVKAVTHLVTVYEFMIKHGENDVNRWSYYDEYIKSNKIKKARQQHPELDELVVTKIRNEEIKRAVDVREQLPVICSSPRALTRFVNQTSAFTNAYESAVSSGAEDTNLGTVKRFRNWLTRPEVEEKLLNSEGSIRKNAVYELRKIADRTKHLLKKMEK